MITNRKTTILSPWVTLVEKTLHLKSGPALYHSFQQNDYVAILAVREDGKIPIVRQFRNAAEQWTWELPGGYVDTGSTTLEACHQELYEEVGLKVQEAHYLGSYITDGGRLDNKLHSFLVTAISDKNFIPEPDVEPSFVSLTELTTMVKDNEFISALHLSTLFLASHHPKFQEIINP